MTLDSFADIRIFSENLRNFQYFFSQLIYLFPKCKLYVPMTQCFKDNDVTSDFWSQVLLKILLRPIKEPNTTTSAISRKVKNLIDFFTIFIFLNNCLSGKLGTLPSILYNLETNRKWWPQQFNYWIQHIKWWHLLHLHITRNSKCKSNRKQVISDTQLR